MSITTDDLRMNPAVQLAVRNADCTNCRMHTEASGRDLCVTAIGKSNPEIVVVTKMPIGPRGKAELDGYLTEVGFEPDRVMYMSALKCRTWQIDPNKTDQKACRPYLESELEFVKPAWVLAMGNEALFATTGHSGITKYRGATFQHASGAQVFATISTAMVARNPGLRAGFLGDLRFFRSKVTGREITNDGTPTENQYHVVRTMDELKAMAKALSTCDVMSIDIESTITDRMEFDPSARIITMATTLEYADGTREVWALPLFHPESPFKSKWKNILRWLAKFLRKPKKIIAHNGKFDCRWLLQFGVRVDVTFDTIIAAHLLNENGQKGLKPLAQQLLGAEPWGISTKDLLTTPLDEVLWYNSLDTWHTMRLYPVLKAELLKNKRLVRLFTRLMMPAQRELVDVERAGVFIDREKLFRNWELAKGELSDVDNQLMEWIPDEHPYVRRSKRTGEIIDQGVNFNPSNFLRWFMFEELQLPILATGKQKDDGSDGAPSVAEAVVMELAEIHEFPKLLLTRGKWNKYNTAFFPSYAAQLDENDRVHTTFKLTGTVTGRLSSGKADEEKLTISRKTKGINLQQVPRDELVRGVFGAPPGWWFVEADFSQIELRVAAYLAREHTMLHLYNTGQDIHMAMAMRMTGKPQHLVTKEERKRAKAVNFGFLYGMGWRKFIQTAWSNYQLRVSEEESRAFRESFFDQFPGLPPWHAKQRRLVNKYGRVESPLGRIRHLPDIYSPNQEVRAEAERQAINSPVQSFASDMALLSLVLISEQFRERGMQSHAIGTVHDAVNFEIPQEEAAIALPIIKGTMENLPLEEMFDVHLDIPIIADLKLGTHWGGARELTEEEVYAWAG